MPAPRDTLPIEEPHHHYTIFQNNLLAFTGARLASWTVWIAPTTMKAIDVAKRVGMSEADFRNTNNIPPRMMIRAGSSLLIPRGSHIEQDVAVRVADNGQVSLAPEIVLRRTVIKAGKNDSVASVSKHYRVTPANVADWNKVPVSSSFKQGQQIVLFLPPSRTQKQATPGNHPGQATAKVKPTQVARR